jgi:transforming growth factor-beta-induced protein
MKTVKLFFSALLVGVVTTFTSCSEDDAPEPKNIVQLAQETDDLSILVQALTRPDLTINFVEVLSGTGPFTVFAPTNAAFAALLVELTPAGQPTIGLNDIPVATLEQVLLYHVANGKVMAGSLTEGQTVTTLQEGTFTIGLSGGAKITDENNRVSNIVTTDVEASNGVVHLIDKVILPN